MRFDGGTLQDIRYCSRMLAKHPGFTAVAVLMLAAGIGANAAVFSLSNELFLRTAPAVTEPGRLVALGRSSGGESFDGFGHLTYLKYREQAQSFTGLVASRGARLLWSEGQETVILEGRLVSADYFSLLGVHIAPGRDFLPEEDRTPGTYPVAIISHDVWKNRFGSNPALIDRAVHLNDTEFRPRSHARPLCGPGPFRWRSGGGSRRRAHTPRTPPRIPGRLRRSDPRACAPRRRA